MREAEARAVVARLLADDEWPQDDFSQRARASLEEVGVAQQADGAWAVRLLFTQGPHRFGLLATQLRTLTTDELCDPDVFASEVRMFAVEEPHGPAFGEPDTNGRHWQRG